MIGRELALNLIDYLTSSFHSNQTVRRLLTSARIHILPTMNPDGFAKARPGDCMNVFGRSVVHESAVFNWATCPLQGTFPILAGDITPSAVMKKIISFLRSISVALQEIQFSLSLSVRTVYFA